MDEQARKRKLSEIDDSDVEGIEREKPKEGLKAARNDKKKRKIDATQATKPSKSESVAKVGVEDAGNDAARKAKAEQRNIKTTTQERQNCEKAGEAKGQEGEGCRAKDRCGGR